MTDLSVTAADVQAASGADIRRATAGAAIAAGEPIYIDPTDSLAKLAANTSQTLANCVGIALHAADAGQPVTYIAEGNLDVGATLTVGELYILSAAGAISPVGDAESNDWMTYLGIATAADNLRLNIQAGGVQLA